MMNEVLGEFVMSRILRNRTIYGTVNPRARQERSVLERHQKLEISEVQTSRTAVLDGSQKPKVSDDTSAFVKLHSAEDGLRDIKNIRNFQFLSALKNSQNS